MAVNPTVAKHLSDARRELVAQREALDRDIEALDRMLEGYPVSTSTLAGRDIEIVVNDSSGLTDEAAVDLGPPAPPMKDLILEILGSADREFSTNEVVKRITAKYRWQASSIRSLIGKMARDGLIVQTRRGVYRAHLTDTSAPSGELGAEVTGEPNSDSPRMEGGTEYGSAPPDGRDDRALHAHETHDHGGHRAAIEAVR